MSVILSEQIMIGGEEERWLYGRYSCIAKNIYGYVTDSATLVEAGESHVTLACFMVGH